MSNESELKNLVLKNRSYRRYYQEKTISMDTLRELVDMARNTASGANRQPLRYKLVNEPDQAEKVFECLAWAGYYKDWPGPVEGEHPSAYILVITTDGCNAPWDEGIAAQTLLLGAVKKDLGGCILANIDRVKLAKNMQLPEGYKIDLCIALGYPKEKVVLEDVSAESDIKYYRDKDQVQHVPKKRLEEILL